ncbi:MAG: hypothetical protein IKQ99_03040 [Alphaproteobacteria bacterium]|nr:hypothetical protein [Alphaproteobacteria bacterium]
MKKVILLFLLLSGCSFSRGIEITDLRGKSTKEIETAYGKPVVVRYEGEQQMWAYKQGECYRLIFFDATKKVQFAESRGTCPTTK